LSTAFRASFGILCAAGILLLLNPTPVLDGGVHVQRIELPSYAPPIHREQLRHIEIYPDPYDEREVTRPYNPGPKIIIAPVPKVVYEHKNLHLPDPVCIAGCGHSKGNRQ